MTFLSSCMVFDQVKKRSNAMSHDVYILSILCAISMYISFCEFVQTAHSTREKKILVVFFFEDDDIFPRASSSHHGYWNSLQGPFFDFVLCLCCGGIFFAVSFNNVKWSLVSFGLAFLVSSYNHLQHYILLYIHLNLIIVVS